LLPDEEDEGNNSEASASAAGVKKEVKKKGKKSSKAGSDDDFDPGSATQPTAWSLSASVCSTALSFVRDGSGSDADAWRSGGGRRRSGKEGKESKESKEGAEDEDAELDQDPDLDSPLDADGVEVIDVDMQPAPGTPTSLSAYAYLEVSV
jgi:hypothetical protein